MHPHSDVVSLVTSDNLDKTDSSGCSSSGQVNADDEEESEAGVEYQVVKEGTKSDFSVGALLSRVAVAAGITPPPSPPTASALDWDPREQRQGPLPVYHDFVKHLQGSWAGGGREAVAPHSALRARFTKGLPV